MTIEASAPGKAVLSGEYAVLMGAPAIAMAVDRRARVRIEPAGDSVHRVTAPGVHAGAAVFRAADDGSLQWLDGAAAAEHYALLEQVWRVVRPPAEPGLALTLDTRPFFRQPGGRKLGFGSSAALATALAAALLPREAAADELYRTAAVAHRNFQDGRGSGVDVATAVHGGAIAWRMEEALAERLEWPAGLAYEVLWSGRPVSTADRLARFAATNRGASAGALVESAEAVFDAWHERSAAAVLASLRSYTAALQHFSEEHGLGVFEGGHEALLAEAKGREVVYKPCGAGGGDVGVAFAEDRAALAGFAAAAQRRGFELLAAACDPGGVQRQGVLAP
jgi:phosphomevalonate kinase